MEADQAFEGLLPEGFNLDALLRNHKIDRDDNYSQLIATGADLPGTVTIEALVAACAKYNGINFNLCSGNSA